MERTAARKELERDIHLVRPPRLVEEAPKEKVLAADDRMRE